MAFNLRKLFLRGKNSKPTMNLLKQEAQKLGLPYLSNIPMVKGFHTLERFKGKKYNCTQIFVGESWEEVLPAVEKALKRRGTKDVFENISPSKERVMNGIPNINKNWDNYEIRVLRVGEYDLAHSAEHPEGGHQKVVELTIGRVK